MNVWDNQMWGSDWRLCARVIGGFDPNLAVVNIRPGTEKVRLYLLHPDGLPDFFAEFDVDPAFPHFPYGIEVEPD